MAEDINITMSVNSEKAIQGINATKEEAQKAQQEFNQRQREASKTGVNANKAQEQAINRTSMALERAGKLAGSFGGSVAQFIKNFVQVLFNPLSLALVGVGLAITYVKKTWDSLTESAEQKTAKLKYLQQIASSQTEKTKVSEKTKSDVDTLGSKPQFDPNSIEQEHTLRRLIDEYHQLGTTYEEVVRAGMKLEDLLFRIAHIQDTRTYKAVENEITMGQATLKSYKADKTVGKTTAVKETYRDILNGDVVLDYLKERSELDGDEGSTSRYEKERKRRQAIGQNTSVYNELKRMQQKAKDNPSDPSTQQRLKELEAIYQLEMKLIAAQKLAVAYASDKETSEYYKNWAKDIETVINKYKSLGKVSTENQLKALEKTLKDNNTRMDALKNNTPYQPNKNKLDAYYKAQDELPNFDSIQAQLDTASKTYEKERKRVEQIVQLYKDGARAMTDKDVDAVTKATKAYQQAVIAYEKAQKRGQEAVKKMQQQKKLIEQTEKQIYSFSDLLGDNRAEYKTKNQMSGFLDLNEEAKILQDLEKKGYDISRMKNSKDIRDRQLALAIEQEITKELQRRARIRQIDSYKNLFNSVKAFEKQLDEKINTTLTDRIYRRFHEVKDAQGFAPDKQQQDFIKRDETLRYNYEQLMKNQVDKTQVWQKYSTNELTQRGGFAGGAVAEKTRNYGMTIAQQQAQSQIILRDIRTLMRDIKNF